jgi:hypothetical protein
VALALAQKQNRVPCSSRSIRPSCRSRRSRSSSSCRPRRSPSDCRSRIRLRCGSFSVGASEGTSSSTAPTASSSWLGRGPDHRCDRRLKPAGANGDRGGSVTAGLGDHVGGRSCSGPPCPAEKEGRALGRERCARRIRRPHVAVRRSFGWRLARSAAPCPARPTGCPCPCRGGRASRGRRGRRPAR